ncbi:MAG: hypothetical protein M1822_008628 [Bathelium mastoideum]|nr:MAG: hypothetical protein M1822_008628 [Bathelium mastoideum]
MSASVRQSTAASASRLELPAYESPLYSLSSAQQRDLQHLEKFKSLTNLSTHLQHANECITAMAADINDRYTERQTSFEKRKTKRSHQAMGEDGPDLQEEETELEAMRERVDKITQRMEETVRKIIDSSKYVESIGNGLREAQKQATGDAARATQHTQSQAQGRSTAGDEESQADFEPTDPGASARAESLSKLYTNKLEREKERWQTFSLQRRYAQHKDYKAFRDLVHDAQNPDGDTEPSNPDTWFSDRPGSPAPGITRRHRTSNGENSDDGSESDTSDIAIARERISTKCPLTLREFEDPVTSARCPHSFEKTAIQSLIRESQIRDGPQRERVVQCPVGGCSQMLSEKDMRSDPTMVRKIRRLQAAKARAADEDSDDGGEDGDNGVTVVEELGSDDGEEEDGASDGAKRAWSVKPKMEPRSTRTPRATTEIISMGGTDTEEE